jgi:plastocyanin
MNRRAFLGSAGAAASLGLAGCLTGGSGASQDYDVGMGAATFEPARIEVSVDETVVWMNTNSRAHTVTAYEAGIPEDAEYFASGGYDSEEAARNGYQPGNPDSGDIPAGESYEHTFEVTGTYEYFCIPHESTMVGTIVVE